MDIYVEGSEMPTQDVTFGAQNASCKAIAAAQALRLCANEDQGLASRRLHGSY